MFAQAYMMQFAAAGRQFLPFAAPSLEFTVGLWEEKATILRRSYLWHFTAVRPPKRVLAYGLQSRGKEDAHVHVFPAKNPAARIVNRSARHS